MNSVSSPISHGSEDTFSSNRRVFVPIEQRANLTIVEGSQLWGIGQNRLREILKNHKDPSGLPLTLSVGDHRVLIRRERFERYLNSIKSV